MRFRQKLQTRMGALECVVSGSGTPNIVLVNGAGMTLEGWRALFPAVERMGTVFAWNRFGAGESDPPMVAQTGAVVVACLSTLLGFAGLAGPLLLVGHSIGGLHANLFARLHPERVAGVLFVEATHPRDRKSAEEHESRIAASIARVLNVPQRAFRRNLHAEMQWLPETLDEIAGAGEFPDVPVSVISGAKPPPRWLMPASLQREHHRHQRQLARLSRRGEHIVARASGHFPQVSEPRLVLGALDRVIERAGLRARPGA